MGHNDVMRTGARLGRPLRLGGAVAGCAALAACTVLSGADRLSVREDPETPLPGRDGGGPVDADRDAAPASDAGPLPLTDAATEPCDEPGLLAWWRFDEGAGDVVHDCTSYGHDGRLDGGTWIAGKRGGALSFDGGWVGFGDPAALRVTGPLTVTAWIREERTDSPETQYIVSRRADGNSGGGWRFATEPPALTMSVVPGLDASFTETKGGSVGGNTWVHVAAVFEPGQAVSLYVGGTREARRTTNIPAALVQPPAEVRVGARGDGAYPFVGAIDDVRIYGRALDEAEIAALATP